LKDRASASSSAFSKRLSNRHVLVTADGGAHIEFRRLSRDNSNDSRENWYKARWRSVPYAVEGSAGRTNRRITRLSAKIEARDDLHVGGAILKAL
jgi:hypothetical protein